MDFTYTPEQEAYRMEVRAWLEANQPPPLTPEEKERADENFLWERLKRWHKKLYDGGWAGLTWPKAVRRARRDLRRAGHLPAGTRAAQPADGMQRARRDHDRPGADAVGHRGAEEALPAEDPERGRDLVRRDVGAGRRLGPRRDADPRRARGRLLYRQRAEGLDHARPSLALLPALRAHRSRRSPSTRG